MANELSVDYPIPSLATIYFVVSQPGNKRYNTSGTPAFETTNLAHWPQYAIAGADAGAVGTYEASFPAAIPAGTIVALYAYLKAGGSPASTDTKVGGGGPFIWNGTSLAQPTDTVASNGTAVKSSDGGIVSALATSVVLPTTGPGADPNATNNLKGWSVEFTAKRRYGVITDASITGTKAIGGGWSDGVTPTAGDSYRLVKPGVLDKAGLNFVPGFKGWHLAQSIRAVASLVLGKRSGVPAPGSAATVTFTDAAAGDYGTVTVDANGNITANSMTPPV